MRGGIFHAKVLKALYNFMSMFVHDIFCENVNLLYLNARIYLLSSDAASVALSFQDSTFQPVLSHFKFTTD